MTATLSCHVVFLGRLLTGEAGSAACTSIDNSTKAAGGGEATSEVSQACFANLLIDSFETGFRPWVVNRSRCERYLSP